MNRKSLLSLAGAAVVAFMAASTAKALPADSAFDTLKTLGAEQGIVTEAALVCTSRCWRQAGRRICKKSCTGVRPDDRPDYRPGYRPLK
jgi:hypothetical protein